MQNTLPEWKRKWSEWKQLYSKCLQMAVRRIKNSEPVLESLQERGFNRGRLKWNPPREYRSITYNQSGCDVDPHTGRAGHALAHFSKSGDFHVDSHRSLPDDADITKVSLEKQNPGDWTLGIDVEYGAEYPDKPSPEDMTVDDTVGIHLGIIQFVHDSKNRTFARLDEAADRTRVGRRHRSLSRKQHDSANWNKARQSPARAYERLTDRREYHRQRRLEE